MFQALTFANESEVFRDLHILFFKLISKYITNKFPYWKSWYLFYTLKTIHYEEDFISPCHGKARIFFDRARKTDPIYVSNLTLHLSVWNSSAQLTYTRAVL